MIATYDESRWPVVVCTVKAGLRPQGSFSAHLGELESYIARGPCVLVIDQSRADPLQPRERKLVASLIRRANTTYRGRLLGVAIVFESKLKVGIVTAVHWLAQPGYPFKAAMSVDSALAWASAVASGVSAEPK